MARSKQEILDEMLKDLKTGFGSPIVQGMLAYELASGLAADIAKTEAYIEDHVMYALRHTEKMPWGVSHMLGLSAPQPPRASGLTWNDFYDAMDKLGVDPTDWDEEPAPGRTDLYVVKVKGPDGNELGCSYAIGPNGWTSDSPASNAARQAVYDGYVKAYGSPNALPPATKTSVSFTQRTVRVPLTEADVERAAGLKGLEARTHASGDYKTMEIFNGRECLSYEAWNQRTGDSKQAALECLMGAVDAFVAKPARLGVSNAARVQCKKSQYHGFHAADEKCPLCP